MWFENKQFLFYFAFTLATFLLVSHLLYKNKQNNEIGKLALVYIIGLVVVYYIIKWLVNNKYDTLTWVLVLAITLTHSYYLTNKSCGLCAGQKAKIF